MYTEWNTECKDLYFPCEKWKEKPKKCMFMLQWVLLQLLNSLESRNLLGYIMIYLTFIINVSVKSWMLKKQNKPGGEITATSAV